MAKDGIEDLRKTIDQIDLDLLELLNRRASLAQRIGELKQSADPGGEVYAPARESGHLRELVEKNGGPLEARAVTGVFREVMSACRALERNISVAYLGPQGTFTMEAVLRHFGSLVETRSLLDIEEVFRSVEADESDYGVVPIENSSEGAVVSTLDCLVDSPLQIIGEVELRVSHCLLGKERDLASIKAVYGHRQALAQCRKWVGLNLPHCRKVGVESSVLAAQHAAREANTAAIAGAAAAAEGLQVLAKDIEDHPENTTRFLVVGKRGVQTPSGCDKTSVIVSARNRPGSLAGLLQVLANHGLSMTRIESRPARTANWEYLFFLDIEGHCKDEAVACGLAELHEKASFYKLLGSYPCGAG